MGAKANIVVDQGADFATTITVRDDSGNAINLTNYTGHGQIRKHYTSTIAHNMQIVFENPRTNGQITLKLSRTQTANLASGRYVYDVKIITSGGQEYKAIEGTALVRSGVTR